MFTLLLLIVTINSDIQPYQQANDASASWVNTLTGDGPLTYFVSDHPWYGTQIFATDGTSDGTEPVTRFSNDPFVEVLDMWQVGDLIYYQRAEPEKIWLGLIDGRSLVKETLLDSPEYFQGAYQVIGETLYIRSGSAMLELFRGDIVGSYEFDFLERYNETARFLFHQEQIFAAVNRAQGQNELLRWNGAAFERLALFGEDDENPLWQRGGSAIQIYGDGPRLWLAQTQVQYRHGVWRYHLENNTLEEIFASRISGWSIPGIRAAVFEDRFYFNVATEDAGVVLFHIGGDETEPTAFETDRAVVDLLVHKERLLLGGFDGLFAFQEGALTPISEEGLEMKSGTHLSLRRDGQVYGFFQDQNFRTRLLRTDGTQDGTRTVSDNFRVMRYGLNDSGLIGSRPLQLRNEDERRTIFVDYRPRNGNSSYPFGVYGDRALGVDKETGVIREYLPEGPVVIAEMVPDRDLAHTRFTPMEDGRVVITQVYNTTALIYDCDNQITEVALAEYPRQVVAVGEKFFYWTHVGRFEIDIWMADDQGSTFVERIPRIYGFNMARLGDRLVYTQGEDFRAVDLDGQVSVLGDYPLRNPGWFRTVSPQDGDLNAMFNIRFADGTYYHDRRIYVSDDCVREGDLGAERLVDLAAGRFLLSHVLSPVLGNCERGEFVTSLSGENWYQSKPVDGRLFLLTQHEEFVLTDGTPEGTRILETGFEVSNGKYYTQIDDRVFFSIIGKVNGETTEGALCVFNMTDETLTVLDDGLASRHLSKPVVVADQIFYSLQTEEDGIELGYSDGTLEGTGYFDVVPGKNFSQPQQLLPAGDRLFFFGYGEDRKWYQYLYNPEGTVDPPPPPPQLFPDMRVPRGAVKFRGAYATALEIPEGATLKWTATNAEILTSDDVAQIIFMPLSCNPVKLTLTVTLGDAQGVVEKEVMVLCI